MAIKIMIDGQEKACADPAIIAQAIAAKQFDPYKAIVVAGKEDREVLAQAIEIAMDAADKAAKTAASAPVQSTTLSVRVGPSGSVHVTGINGNKGITFYPSQLRAFAESMFGMDQATFESTRIGGFVVANADHFSQAPNATPVKPLQEACSIGAKYVPKDQRVPWTPGQKA